MPTADNKILDEAIARNAGIVFSLPSAGMLRHHKSRFLGETDEGIWVEAPPSERALIDEVISSEKPAGISFKSGITKVIFTTPILRRDEKYGINDTTAVEAALLEKPAAIKAIQRRNNYRVSVPKDCEVTVKMWRIAERAYLRDRPMAAQEIQVQLRDLSLGGLGCTLSGKDGNPPVVSPEDRLRLQITAKGNPLLLEGRLAYPKEKPKSDIVKAGIQFKGVENSIEGRQTLAQLTRIVGELAREEVRRLRLGIKAA